jgi:hypothetical protein
VPEDQRLKSDKKIWKQKFPKRKKETMKRKENRGASKPIDLLPENKPETSAKSDKILAKHVLWFILYLRSPMIK